MKWRVHCSFHFVDRAADLPIYNYDFEESDLKKAHRRILTYVKTRTAKLGRVRGKWFCLLVAMPYLPSGKVLNGEKMVCLKHDCSDRRIMKATDPDQAFVYG
ncbi:MAG: hypothetical protein A3J07_02500 [Candidatus Doudnabacteria bacterium RIFCSPLOWO2_02_FULL_49_13]|uniref:Uncharacterized protein n=1 Tax=Candidatus Doudnabacteria bacterium RIFCSPHIGHO2_12_FULL_48_16 TaxID=1817838 RepID=A0A1F5PKW9_9BACT|nr:MAG: hypothetical protein A3B77_03325 [Candidatus Doudnabacteria bacterium RIFCSPHIGHO2_02_FULL_49_24]OGE89153.1 MAG: hypothetical protein A2760_02070 [Candidatus Doudnabacteria bacterium RIFCSPHIGHO2_01_FULL_50_67]OGE90551.1 MAG: hypothetical protein A3E29_02015 [Candidatus Doudnabacteria bacterium RIFCSPHIGHO2_12_FULL_48_16]OGE97179.1 MAG: hypothetical protein A2990_01100 [Candidatus Doudnabacteria bacterium RIFCSPLOWO2_01_FULL_49_40]OGF02943.1 MAG: hypothetical protein A3J07_02500 [Candid